MKKLIKRTLFVLTPVLLFVVAVNYFGDAANLFSDSYEKTIAENLLSGKNVTNVYNYNERLLQKQLINGSPVCPEVLVIGSSRAMLINSDYFAPRTFFNNSVSGASIEDLLAIFRMVEQKKCVPEKVILCLDPWTLNCKSGQTRWATLSDEYYSMFNTITGSKKEVKEAGESSKYIQLVSPSYFKGSLKNLFSSTKPVITKSKVNNAPTRLTDGSISYDLKYRSASVAEVQKRAMEYMNNGIYGIEDFNQLSPEIMMTLEKFITYLKTKNIEVLLFLAPYHPKVYEYIAKTGKYAQVIKSEKYFIELSKKCNVNLIGSFDPEILNLDDSYFYDGMHCKESAIEKILMSEKE
jgi:hypothetical protein